VDPIQPGQILAGKYRVLRVIGVGGMGQVFLARHDLLEQKVAIKVLHGEFAGEGEHLERFMREAKACAKLQSEHAIRVMDVGKFEDGSPYLVMECLDGRDLDQLVGEQGPLPSTDAVDYILEALDAIAEAHALSIIHRDLKPSNLFLANRVDGSTTIKVLDFGISKQLTAPDKHKLTGAHLAMGTPAYMAPEQLKNARDVDARADIWSLGVVLFEILTGTLPFAGDSPTEFLANILTEPPASLHARRGDAPPGLEEVIGLCLRRKPDDRYATVAELAEALAPFGSGRTAEELKRIRSLGSPVPSAQPSAPRARAPLAETVVAQSSGSTLLTWKTPGVPLRGHAASIGVGVGAAALIVAGAVMFVRSSASKSASLPSGTPAGLAAVGAIGSAGSAPRAPAASATPDWTVITPTATAEASAIPLVAAPAAHPVAAPPPTGASAPAPPPTTVAVAPEVAPAPPPRPSPAAAPATPKPSVVCDPPFTLDDQGRKHFKPECYGVKK
jgi:serine/threonine-protein kinase